MKQWLIRMLLRALGVRVVSPIKLKFYAIVTSSERVCDVTTNPNKARAIAKTWGAKVWVCRATEPLE